MFCPLCDCLEHFDVIWENQTVSLVFDNYGLHYGHLLLIPKEHVLNLSCAYPQISSCLPKIVQQMREFFRTEILVYEHGNVTENKTSNYSIDHAHLHFLPVFHSVKRIIDTFCEGIVSEKANLSDFYEQEKKYPYHLLSMNGADAIYTFTKLKSEAFREAYAVCEGVELWDWKIFGKEIQEYNHQHQNDKLLLKQSIAKELQHIGLK